MQYAFVIFYEKKLLVVLTWTPDLGPKPLAEHVLDWYEGVRDRIIFATGWSKARGEFDDVYQLKRLTPEAKQP